MVLERKLKNLNRLGYWHLLKSTGPGAETMRHSACLSADNLVGIRIPLSAG